MKNLKIALSLVLCCLLVSQRENLASAQADTPPSKQRMTPELLWKLGRLGSVAVSPDGSVVAYSVRRFELAENKGRSSLYLLDLKSGESKPLLEDWKSIGALYWVKNDSHERLWFEGIPSPSPSTTEKTDVSDLKEPQSPGQKQAFSDNPSKDDGADKLQAWFFDKGATLPTRSTFLPEGISNLKVAPSGDRIAFTQNIKLDQTVNELYPDLPQADARIIDNLMYRHWNEWHDYKYSHLHVAKLDEKGVAQEARDLMKDLKADCPVPPMGGSEQFDWAPDGKTIAYTLKDVPDWAQSTNSDVFLVSIDGDGNANNLSVSNEGYDNNPLFSPDGKWLVYSSMQRPGFEADRNRLILVDRSTGASRELTEGLDQNVNHPQWLPDSSGLLFDSEMRGTNQVLHLDLASGKVNQISEGHYDWQVQAILPDGKKAVATRVNMIRPHELVELSLPASNSGKENRVLTQINDEMFDSLELPTVEERWVKASDGQSILCWVIYPPGFDKSADKKWPMLTYCQGGPQSQVSQFFSYRWNFHLMAANDYVVLAINRRGLPGFGQKWNDEISGDWGGQAMRDLLSATDDLKKDRYIDSKRIGAVGASFGGYSVYWLMGNSGDRFCAMISHCGVFNLESMYGTTEELFFVNYDLGGPYWASAEILAKYQKFSPHRFVGNWKTPLLVIHGEKDFRVPIGQGMEAFTAAQVQGVPSRFLYFPEEGHWVMSPQNGVLWNRVFFDWLDRYCKPNSDGKQAN
jgi:dipeptidyl aminopeptidase/acylaminoacyl peptidase